MTTPLPKVIFQDADAQTAPGSSNKHVSVDPEGNHLVDLEFIEEPLGVTAEQGQGFLRVEFGEAIGPDSRYEVARKLGWGMNSSIWLALDRKENKYVAIKALKGYATNLAKRGITWELPALERIASEPPPAEFKSTHWPRLLDHFVHPGSGEDGEHLCLVTDVLGGDVEELQVKVAKKKGLPLPLAKRILLHTLRGLFHLHSCSIVHTDLKHDNIMFDLGSQTQADIAALLKADPSRRHPPEESWNCTVEAAVSQPLPLPSLSDAMKRTYLVSDLGCAQPSNVHTFEAVTTPVLRAPELVLKGPWNEKVDIWAFGCLIFELLTRRSLFVYRPEGDVDAEMSHLWQILAFTCERMKREQVEASKLGTQYFNIPADPSGTFCKLKRLIVRDRPFSELLKEYKVLSEEEVIATARIMQRCLRLDPKDRATAKELLRDPWWQVIE
ncbi:Serine/threonine-protein kinase SRPK [Hypsizygus marmoreus]|uniref:non-specific serine/threonine protein kinase n=1 Tax=Hypsizygus marmoreus TaxID=39966 RepID=A0A369K2E1_HYPMA|nr:Serine/threonine-protein kinase SRPK [Hypsizygus marmoreus]